MEESDIIQVHNRYCWAVDDGDADALAAVFTEDCVWRCEPPVGVFRGRDGVQEMGRIIHGGTGATVLHVTTNHVVDVDGDTARLRCYLTVPNWGASQVGVSAVGRYDVAFVRQSGAWLIREMSIEMFAWPGGRTRG